MRSSRKHFSLIILPLTVVKTSRSADGYLLTENYLYTTDAISDYLAHLADDGQLVFLVHGRVETYRLVSILLPVLQKAGLTVKQAMDHLYVVGNDKMTLVAARKRAFTLDDMVARYALAKRLRAYEGTPNETIVFFPHLPMTHTPGLAPGDGPKAGDVMDKALLGLYTRHTLGSWLQALRFDPNAVTDNRPFFYNVDGKPPQTLKDLLHVSIGILGGSVLVPPLLAFLIGRTRRSADGTRRWWRRACPGSAMFSLSHNWRNIVIFILLGAGFMMVEMALIQKFILFLGQPVLSLSMLLVALFVGMGIGGVGSKYFVQPSRYREIVVVLIALVGVIAAHIWIVPGIITKYLGSTLLMKTLISISLITPLGLLIGMPFPYMLNLLKMDSRQSVIPWMWGINGVSSVCGSMLAVTIGILYGFDTVLLTGMGMYASIIWFL